MISIGNYWRIALVVVPSIAGGLPLALLLFFIYSGGDPPKVLGYDIVFSNLIVLAHLAFFAPAYVVWIFIFLVATAWMPPRRMQQLVWLVPAGYFLTAGAVLWLMMRHPVPGATPLAFDTIIVALLPWMVGGYVLVLIGFALKRVCTKLGVVRREALPATTI